MNKFKELDNQLEFILKNHERTRNDDRELYQKILEIFHGVHFNVSLQNFPSPETIDRKRRKLQSKGWYLPTDPAVAKRRRQQTRKIQDWNAESEAVGAL
jgi:hypothetical protein